MNRKIATLNPHPIYGSAIRTQIRSRWLLALNLFFMAVWHITDDEYFMYFTAGVTIALVLNTLAGWALTEASNAKLIEDLEKRGLSKVQHIEKGILIAQFGDQKVWVHLIEEGRAQMGVWVKPYHT